MNISREQIQRIKDKLVGSLEGDDFEQVLRYINHLENMTDNAHEALSAVIASGDIMRGEVLDMAERGLNNEPQKSATRLG